LRRQKVKRREDRSMLGGDAQDFLEQKSFVTANRMVCQQAILREFTWVDKRTFAIGDEHNQRIPEMPYELLPSGADQLLQ
jgi:hypothetical protein